MKQLISSVYTSSLLVLLSIIYSCNCKPETESHSKMEETKKNDQKGSIVLNNEQLKAVGIEIGTMEQKNLLSIVKASGQLAVPPQNKAEINVLIGGIVQKINVLEGQNV